jgi:hypothetical protein
MGSRWRIGNGIVILLIGILLGIFVSKISLFEIEPKLDFGNLLQVLTTLILALLISKWWRDQHFRTDSAKNILLEYVRDLRAKQAEIRTAFRTLISNDWNQAVFTRILGDFRDASNLLLEIETTATTVFRHDPCVRLRKELLALKRSVTSLTPTRHRAVNLGEIEAAFSQFHVSLAHAQTEVLRL